MYLRYGDSVSEAIWWKQREHWIWWWYWSTMLWQTSWILVSNQYWSDANCIALHWILINVYSSSWPCQDVCFYPSDTFIGSYIWCQAQSPVWWSFFTSSKYPDTCFPWHLCRFPHCCKCQVVSLIISQCSYCLWIVYFYIDCYFSWHIINIVSCIDSHHRQHITLSEAFISDILQ